MDGDRRDQCNGSPVDGKIHMKRKPRPDLAARNKANALHGHSVARMTGQLLPRSGDGQSHDEA